MSAILKVLVPDATINYVKNPSMRYDTTGWTAVGSVISRVLTYALFGISSLMITTSGLGTREGVYYRVNDLVGINEPITASVYARGAGSVHLRLIEGLGKEWVSPAVTLRTDRWTRLEVSGYSTGSNDMRLCVETSGDPRAITFYVDGAQMERKAYSTTYCDGDQPGCRWNIMDSASNASRSAFTREGGRWVELAGPCRESDNIYVTALTGMGMAPIVNNIQSWALSPGSYFQNTKILDRVMTFAFTVKNKNLRMITKPDLSKLHELRQQLIDIFKPDVTGANEPFLLSYQEGERELFIPVRYESGLEGDWDIRNSWVNSFPIRFLAVDPIFTENNYHAQELSFKNEIMFHGIGGRIDGKWDNLNYGLSSVTGNGGVANIEVGRLKQVFASGTFTKGNYSALAIDPMIPAKYISYWDGTKWNLIGTAPDGTTINDIAVAPNGDVYATGNFTNIGGVAAACIAKWNGSVWSALGSGFDNHGYHIAIAPNGDLYVGGRFHTAGGVTAYHIARWDGTAWHALGATLGVDGSTDGRVYSIAISPDGNQVYIAGMFEKIYGAGTNNLLHVALYDPATNIFTQVGGGFDNNATEIQFSPSGILYAVGDFDYSGSTLLNHIGKWNGSAWVPLGNGVSDGVISSLDISDDENIVIAGTFTHTGSIETNKIALWNGSTWVNLDIEIGNGGTNPAPSSVRFIGEDIYIGGAYFSSDNFKSSISNINIVSNTGTKEVHPIIYIYGPGRLRWIENQSTHKTVYLDLLILDNEDVFFDFGKSKVWSTMRGNLSYSILPGSDFSDFSLVPGENKLAVFMTNDVASKMVIYYRPQFWSADSTVNAGALP